MIRPERLYSDKDEKGSLVQWRFYTSSVEDSPEEKKKKLEERYGLWMNIETESIEKIEELRIRSNTCHTNGI